MGMESPCLPSALCPLPSALCPFAPLCPVGPLPPCLPTLCPLCPVLRVSSSGMYDCFFAVIGGWRTLSKAEVANMRQVSCSGKIRQVQTKRNGPVGNHPFMRDARPCLTGSPPLLCTTLQHTLQWQSLLSVCARRQLGKRASGWQRSATATKLGPNHSTHGELPQLSRVAVVAARSKYASWHMVASCHSEFVVQLQPFSAQRQYAAPDPGTRERKPPQA